jgi:mannose-6-phosphate isomerase-like protein (cupin superfamily)
MNAATGRHPRNAWRRLAHAALVSLVIHFLAGMAMAFILRHGLDTNTHHLERLRFLREYPSHLLWVMGWVMWNLAALSILYYYHCFAMVLEGEGAGGSGLPRYAVHVAAAAVGLDLAAEAIEMGLLPWIAANSLEGVTIIDAELRVLLTWHRAAVLLTGFAANGLYTLSAGILAWCGREHFPLWTSAMAILVCVGGGILSVAALVGNVKGMVTANVVLMPALLLWQGGVWWTARQTRESVPTKLHALQELLRQQAGSGRHYLEFLRVPDLSIGLYVLPAGGVDPQQPHKEDEVYHVVRGQGRVEIGDEIRAVNAGDVIYVPKLVPHRFCEITEELVLLVFFAPAEGTGR